MKVKVNNKDKLNAPTVIGEEEQPDEYIDMSNNWITTIIAFLVWIFISLLNVYTIVQLGISHGDIS